MKKIKKWLILLVFMVIAGFIVCACFLENTEKYQYLNSIDYHVEMQQDGSMRVTETWDIDIKNTNTLFKTFTLNKYKYGDITDVKVVDLQQGKELKQIYEEMYHVTKDCYYALPLSSTKFEIAWGVGMDREKGNRKFQISYTVNDVVTEYNDMQEIYWQFLEEGENTVPAEKVTGTFVLPQDVSNIENLRVWGHGQLNGTIERVDKHTVRFALDNLNPKAMLEIRIVTQDKMFNVNYNKIKSYSYLASVMREEQQWAKEADSKSDAYKKFEIFCAIIYAIIFIYFIFKIVKYYKLNKKDGDGIIYNDLQYFRDIPREGATPAEACYLYNFDKKRLNTGRIQNQAVSSIILDLCLKKVISLRIEQNDVYVKILKEKDGLPRDEQEVYKLLKNTSQNREEFKISDLKLYAKDKYMQYSQAIENMVNYARNNLYNINLVDKSKEKEYTKCENANSLKNMVWFLYVQAIIVYLISLIPIFKVGVAFSFWMGAQSLALELLIILLPLVLVSTYSWHLKSKVGDKIAVLTQQGADEKAKWKGLSNFMKDYSLLDEKEVVDLVLWEKYLVYATAFGISEKVIEQMKAKYPEVFVRESWDDSRINAYPVIYFSTYSLYDGGITASAINNLSNDVGRAYTTSISEIRAHSSSSGGSGGGFSGGGGGRRWRRPEWAEDKSFTVKYFGNYILKYNLKK